MQRNLEKLALRDKNHYYDGDLTINRDIKIINGCLSVSGKLFLKGIAENSNQSHALIINGHLVAHSLLCRAHHLYCTGNIIRTV